MEQAGRVNSLVDRAEAALADQRWAEAKVACEASLPLLPAGAEHHRKRAAMLLRLGVATASLGDVGGSRQCSLRGPVYICTCTLHCALCTRAAALLLLLLLLLCIACSEACALRMHCLYCMQAAPA